MIRGREERTKVRENARAITKHFHVGAEIHLLDEGVGTIIKCRATKAFGGVRTLKVRAVNGQQANTDSC